MLNKKIENELRQLFENNEDILITCVNNINSYDGTFETDVWYEMDMLDDFLYGMSHWEVLELAFYGEDEETESSSFNPIRNYFRFNVYGNLESCDNIDYSDLIDDVIESIINDETIIDHIHCDEVEEIYNDNNYSYEFKIDDKEELSEIRKILLENGYDFIVDGMSIYGNEDNYLEINTVLDDNNIKYI